VIVNGFTERKMPVLKAGNTLESNPLLIRAGGWLVNFVKRIYNKF